MEEVEEKYLREIFSTSLLQTKSMYLGNYGLLPPIHEPSNTVKLGIKALEEYGPVTHLAPLAPPKRKKTRK